MTPLSYAQARVWFGQQLDPASPVYNVYQTWRIRGALDIDVLEKALDTIVRRHSPLRTVFQVVDAAPCQLIVQPSSFELPVEDLRGRAADDLETVCTERALEDVRTPFDLASGPLFRAKLWRLGEDDHVLLMNMHHIITDGWSFGVVQRELGALYQSIAYGNSLALPELPLEYSDYAVEQRQRFEADMPDQMLGYWKKRLADLSPLQLPTDRPGSSGSIYRGAQAGFSLGGALSTQLRSLGREEGVSLFTILLACFKVLLARYSGQTDLAVGTFKHGRMRPELEPLVGMFVNTLVLRSDLSGDPSFRELLQDVRKTCKDAFAHEELPFDRLIDELQPDRQLGRNPLFQVGINYYPPVPAPDLPGLELSPFTVGRQGSSQLRNDTAKFDLELTWYDSGDEIECMVEYSTNVLADSTIRGAIAHLRTLIEAAVADPSQRVSRLPLLSDAERRQLLVEWNATATDYPRTGTLAERFAAQAAATPDAVALVFEEQRLTYGELNDRADRLAGYLQQHHAVSPEVRVGLYLPRGVEMIVGVLGITKAGGAYVPLDPNAPASRLAFILEDADVALVLTRNDVREDLPAEWSGPVIALDGVWPTIAETPAAPLASGVTAESLAYIMYTSGSTGEPKGTSICQRSVLRLVMNTNYLEFGPEETVLQFAPLAFDASTLEIWGSLLHGSKLVIYPSQQASLEELARCLEEHEVSTLWLTAAIFHQMVDGQPAALSGVRQLLAGGDVLSVPHVQRVLAKRPEGGVLINGYGPTENTTFTCCHVMTRESEVEGSVPIGRPIANTQVYVLDPAMQPVPVGVYGELYIGGDGLARDYLKRPALTAEKFVPDPFSEVPGSRLYRTGDVVRYRPEGIIEFQGRRDHQVKLRGYRIELGEVEAVLGQHGGVGSCVALAREDEPGDKRLVAYVVPAGDSLTVSDLRQHLQKRLPDYMVPAHFVMLDALPVTPNGKLDRRALPAPEAVRPELDGAYEAPTGRVEEVLALLWTEVLRVDQVGRHDNFFELGGDSIMGIQIVARAAQAGLRVSPRHIFEHQTIAELAAAVAAVETREPVAAEQSLVTGTLPLTPVQHWFFEQQLEHPDHWNMAWVLEAKEPVDPERMARVVDALLRHHDALRLRFVSDRTGWRQELSEPEDQDMFSFSDLSQLPGAEAEAAYAREADRLHASLDLANGPIIRVALFRFGGAKADRLLLVIHHLAVDGISWRILLEDLQTAYDRLIAGDAIELPAKTSSFSSWAERLVDHARSDSLTDEVEHWRTIVAMPATPLPRDFDGATNVAASTRSMVVELTPEDTHALLQEIPGVYQTRINDVLLAALVDVVAQWTEEDAVCLDLEGHGREELFEDVDLSRTVGWFTTIFPIVLRRGQPANPGDLLKSVKEQIRQIPNRGIGYGLLRYVREDQDLHARIAEGSGPELAFNYLGQFDQVAASDGRWISGGPPAGASRHPEGRQPHLISVVAQVANGTLRVTWNYSETVHRRATIERLAGEYLTSLLATIRHCQSPEAGGYTPSDFPLAGLSQADLDKLL